MKKMNDLDILIEEATIDAYGEDEQRSGFLVIMEENICTPFSAMIAGSPIEVTKFDMDHRRLFVHCRREGKTYSVDVLDIEPIEGTQGVDWISAYRQWCQGVV